MDFPSYSFLFVCSMFGFKEPQDALVKSCMIGDSGHLHSVYSSTIFKLIFKGHISSEKPKGDISK